MLRVREAQKFIETKYGVSFPLRTIYHWVNERILESRKIGGTIFIEEPAIDFFFSKNNRQTKKLVEEIQ